MFRLDQALKVYLHREPFDFRLNINGLALLVDASTRVAPAALKDKLAEFSVGERQFRVFETAEPKVLMVLEKIGAGTDAARSQYAIERDAGLLADLKLFAQGQGA